jgi:hypothetical protein
MLRSPNTSTRWKAAMSRSGSFAWVVVALCLLPACTGFSQDSHEVLVRPPSAFRFADPVPAAGNAKGQWVYAAMSDLAYEAAKERAEADQAAKDGAAPPPPAPADVVASCGSVVRPPVPSEWRAWTDFPSAETTQMMRRNGLFLMVFERDKQPREIVVVFEGTNFAERRDWKANLRWFLRFVPGYEDQYTLTAKFVAEEFHARLKARGGRYTVPPSGDQVTVQGEPVRIVSAGHSLGGGLAQHFAYTFKQSPPTAQGPRVAEVFAFDPSPVTGWSTADEPPRNYNATNLRINRIFEHGEVLAYIRFFTSRLVPDGDFPVKWEYRYNFDLKANIIHNHSMRSLACGLYRAAHDAPAS